MIDLERVRHLLSETTYRPGWKFDATEDPFEGIVVRITAPVTDSYSDRPVTLGINTFLSPNDRISDVAFKSWLQWRLQRIESHESHEWLRYRGQLLYNPHGGDDGN